ncbi:MAG: hemolysin family protein [Bacilli bacterium]|nr:hemolysin family protein [Bacilli bacterium]MDY6362815.1 hemolysin family protein [Bacilli bacterium]
MIEQIGLIIAIIVLIFFSATFSASDIVYATVNKLRLKKKAQKKSKAAKIALGFAENYNETISTILFSNNLVNIAASSLATVLALSISDSPLSTTIAEIILLVIVLLFGELLPKVIGRAFSYSLSLVLAYPIYVLRIIFFPIVFVTSNLGKLIAKIFIREEHNDVDEMSDDELEELVEKVEEDGTIDEDQSELIKSVLDFKDTEAQEIMTPRVDMFAIPVDADIYKLLAGDDIFMHSRVPVYKGTIDNIVGILPTKQLLKSILAKEKINLKSLIIPVKFVPGAMGISEILTWMKSHKNHIVIVKDEFGGTDGLLTMEDILEELVGEMYDEMDKIKEPYTKISRNKYLVDANMNIDDFFDLCGLDISEDKAYNSVGGWVLDYLEKFAKIGDKFKYKNIDVKVVDATNFTVEKVEVTVHKKRDK